jgi:FkbM family methyltransferase
MIPARIRSLFRKKGSMSYAQCGEDLIVRFIFNAFRIAQPSYLDLGAHHPRHMSNTFLFYKQRSYGVCVEPDPILFEQIKRQRPRDICLNIGVGVSAEDKADFYVMTDKALNTFSRQDAERYQSYGKQRIEKIIQIPLVPVSQIISQHFVLPPQFISIDIEGLELAILKSLDFEKFRPTVLCVETLTYTENRTERKLTEVIDFVCSQGFFCFADTYINSIFVDTAMWKNRP